MEKSRRGVFYDLHKSPYRFEGYRHIYVFSSEYRMEVFKKALRKEKERIDNLLNKIGYETTVHINDDYFDKAYEIAQPSNRLILEVSKHGSKNSMDESANG